MKKLIPLLPTTLILAISHTFCCFLPYIALFSGVLGLSYFTYLANFQFYIAIIQIAVLSYNFYLLYFKKEGLLLRPKIIFWLMFVISIFAFMFPYYHHTNAQRLNTFGKNIIYKIK